MDIGLVDYNQDARVDSVYKRAKFLMAKKESGRIVRITEGNDTRVRSYGMMHRFEVVG